MQALSTGSFGLGVTAEEFFLRSNESLGLVVKYNLIGSSEVPSIRSLRCVTSNSDTDFEVVVVSEADDSAVAACLEQLIAVTMRQTNSTMEFRIIYLEFGMTKKATNKPKRIVKIIAHLKTPKRCLAKVTFGGFGVPNILKSPISNEATKPPPNTRNPKERIVSIVVF